MVVVSCAFRCYSSLISNYLTLFLNNSDLWPQYICFFISSKSFFIVCVEGNIILTSPVGSFAKFIHPIKLTLCMELHSLLASPWCRSAHRSKIVKGQGRVQEGEVNPRDSLLPLTLSNVFILHREHLLKVTRLVKDHKSPLEVPSCSDVLESRMFIRLLCLPVFLSIGQVIFFFFFTSRILKYYSPIF